MKGVYLRPLMRILADPEDGWKFRGLCRTGGYHPDLWFPEGRDQDGQIAEAKTVCVQCPVLARCREWALVNSQTEGVWAAMSPKELRKAARNKETAA